MDRLGLFTLLFQYRERQLSTRTHSGRGNGLRITAPKAVKAAINGMLGLAGLRLVRNNIVCLSQTDAALRQILMQLGISVVFDVGAHVGGYGSRLRALGYRGRIISFEPRA